MTRTPADWLARIRRHNRKSYYTPIPWEEWGWGEDTL